MKDYRRNGYAFIRPKRKDIRKQEVEKRMEALNRVSIEARKMSMSLGKYKEYLREKGELYV